MTDPFGNLYYHVDGERSPYAAMVFLRYANAQGAKGITIATIGEDPRRFPSGAWKHSHCRHANDIARQYPAIFQAWLVDENEQNKVVGMQAKQRLLK